MARIGEHTRAYCPHCREITEWECIGDQENYPSDLPPLTLWNCCVCGSTLTLKEEVDHE